MRLRQRLLVMLGGTCLGLTTLGCNLFAERGSGTGWTPVAAAGAADTGVVAASHQEALPAPAEESASPAEPAKPSWQVEDFYPSNLGKTVARMTGRGPDQQEGQALYDEGEEFYRQAVAIRSKPDAEESRERFLEAAKKFAAAAKRWPDSSLEEDGRFRAAESYFFADRYPEAAEQLELLLKKYPNTRYLDVVGARRFQIAKYWLELDEADHKYPLSINWTNPSRPRTDTFGHAVRVFNRMRIDDPLGKLADDATLAAANAYFLRGKFVKADQYYSDLRKSFPSSEHQFVAHFLGLKAKLESYKGPDYAGTVLDEAEKLVKQIHRQFPKEARAHEAELARAYAELQHLKAQRQWSMAQYYERRGQYRAARFYYDLILEKYPRTAFRERAAERLGKTADKPPTPPQRLEWLVNLFPDNRNDKPLMATKPGSSTRR